MDLELGWEGISGRGEILILSFFHKIHLGETRPLIKTCMPKVNFGTSTQTRSNIGYISYKFQGANFEKSFFPNTLKLWKKLPKNIKLQKFIGF